MYTSIATELHGPAYNDQTIDQHNSTRLYIYAYNDQTVYIPVYNDQIVYI